ncbi:hypothetical protein NDN08_000732 [Rhodosorus marinus]|uniref:Thiaminase-2/PQQC domain-containing protein n=1 Tax=Rhodosorus marinus TaxID=101924 RepID=A0AAV8USZ1_9RHOD|nr:hypothetical protein NDN08_000732 [Rhodosorus marinus]
MKTMATCTELLEKHAGAWEKATQHRFLDGVKTGKLELSQFYTWLSQDYYFAREFSRTVGAVLAECPDEDYELIHGGLWALWDEVLWFKEKAAERNVSLGVPMQEACAEYVSFLRSIRSEPYNVQIMCLWAIEYVYNVAWKGATPSAPAFETFAARWGADSFTEYTIQLREAADKSMRTLTEDEKKKVEDHFLKIALLETAFWDMAYSSSV